MRDPPWVSWQAAPDGNTEYVRAMPLSTSSSANFPKALPHAAQESEEHSVAPMRAMQPMLSPENQEKAPGWGPAHGALGAAADCGEDLRSAGHARHAHRSA